MKRVHLHTLLSCMIGTAMCFLSCSDEHGISSVDGIPASFTTGIVGAGNSDATKTRAENGSWESGDKVGIYMSNTKAFNPSGGGDVFRPYEVAADSKTLNALAGDWYYPVDESQVWFFAYYPYDENIDNDYIKSFRMPADQNVSEETKAFDFLYYMNSGEQSYGATRPRADLLFEHRFSKIVLNVTAAEGMSAAFMTAFSNLTITLGDFPATANCDLTNGLVTTIDTEQITTTARKRSTDDPNIYTFEAIVLPHTAAAAPEVSFNLPMAGLDEPITFPLSKTFTSGTSYIYNFTLGLNEADLTGSYVKDWTEEESDVVAGTPVKGSNCYIVPTNSQLVFPVKHAHRFYRELAAFENNNALLSAFLGEDEAFVVDVLWSDTYSGSSEPSTTTDIDKSAVVSSTSAVEDVKMLTPGHSGHILVKTGSKEGNAVVALRKSVGEDILFSWHIWVTNFDPETTKKTDSMNGYTWMDRNIGATSNQDNTVGALGLLYQWGRKDPFPGSKDHTTAEPAPIWYHTGSDKYEKVIITSTEDLKDEVFFLEGPKDVSESLSSSVCFLWRSSGDWCSSPDDNISPFRWFNEREKALDDPCPVGWRVPWGGRLYTFVSPWLEWDKYSDFSWNEYGRGATDTSLGWWPAVGYRYGNSGLLNGVGTSGYYWSATRGDAINGRFLYFFDNGVSTGSNNKSRGFSVRCVQD